MSAPWSVELNEDILIFSEGNSLEVLSDEDLDWLGIPIFWDILGVEVLLEVSVEVVLSELGEVLLRQLGEVRGVLVNSLGQLGEVMGY